MPRILRINTRERSWRFEEPGKYAGLGGRSLTSRLVQDEVPADTHALSAENRIVAAIGLLSGTGAANSGRISIGAKSPLTGGIKESNSGGSFCQKLARLDILALVLEDKPEPNAPLVNIVLTKDGVRFDEAGDMAGKGTYACMDAVSERYGKKACAMLIGPAGESLLTGASIQFSDPWGRPARAAGRGGLGAVMGSKRVKAIVIDDEGGTRFGYADEARFKAASKRWAEILRAHPVTGQGLPGFGTAILVNIINEAGAFPTQNFRTGRCEHAPKISGEVMAEYMEKRGGKVKEGCHAGCIIQCSQNYVDPAGEYITSGFEYETVWAFGGNSLIADIDDIARLDRMCDDLGVDTIEIGNTVAIAMDAGIIPWGDGKAALKLLARIADPSDALGRIIGSGVGFAAQAFGIDRVPTVKNQSMPAYDPRAAKGVGVTYATTTMGADHTAGYAICQNMLKVGGDVNPLGKEGQVETSKALQVATATVDSLGLCLFVAFAVLDTPDAVQCICDMVSARHGIDFTPNDFIAIGTDVLKVEQKFNADAGFTPEDDQLPAFMKREPLPPHNVVWDFSVEELQQAKV
ncbi:aldehyde ferredoxin oxidoreductase family protein [Nitratidesulfovibrio vulgaris]|uniref:Aldehyde:ferredoxin oxidoreductase, tungsten-containing n=2 Tax=Nitratidesulfovibrio vulgaris TaxID=881 RepID=Q72CV4_NITV2|nr:aldehyde ferredoxin oxidoreductase C-terminal domain-containing protein [Nitratidesulfovibrio vulgaris]GEB78932.1 aldehyde ferredoxin oxidoreductase [Desulfovibrio desulfuricans]HBW16558.1 aldehyde ferredoxin oxidoreductase [Desulfovibrio sp.]AAS95657.1 aldehyde:ferredoxin oxidoreductase, tungsten-containing [Nitratidesulfovibrio vulgaris str. Hildenborough]ABM28894.1 Aldehyde ferredoxin oxidoreductase [Nitratidesulfovibrio vulgaris DP4]ADP86249.1 Aldehyde ferredoxin oxidoreductase [Nitrati